MGRSYTSVLKAVTVLYRKQTLSGAVSVKVVDPETDYFFLNRHISKSDNDRSLELAMHL